ncbi:hypothetical protein Tco_0369703 [Tanacetum coccineum]
MLNECSIALVIGLESECVICGVVKNNTWWREKISTARQKIVQLGCHKSQESKTSRHVKRGWETKIPQSSGPPIKVGDEAVHKELGDRMERAATTTSSLEAEQDSVDKKRVIITESSIRSDLHLADAGGIDCFLTATIFEELARMGAKSTAWNEFSSTMASAIICLAINQNFNFSKYIFDAMLGDMYIKKIYVNPSHTKKIFTNMKREGKDFSGRVTPLFATMMVQATQDEGVDSGIPNDSQLTHHDDSVPIPSNDPLLSGEDRMQLTELMILCTNLQKQVLDLEKVKDAQAKEIDSLGAQEDASKQGRIKIVDETQGRLDDAEMFDTDDLHGDEVIIDMAVGEKPEKSAKIDEREKKDESSSNKTEIAQDSNAKRVGDKLESDKSRKQKTDKNEEVEEDNE